MTDRTIQTASRRVFSECAAQRADVANEQRLFDPKPTEDRIGAASSSANGNTPAVIANVVLRVGRMIRILRLAGELFHLRAKIVAFRCKSFCLRSQIERLLFERLDALSRHNKLLDDHRMFLIQKADVFAKDRSRSMLGDQLFETVEKSETHLRHLEGK